MNLSLPSKANLVFGGMNVDIHLVKGHFDKKGGYRKLTFDQPLGIALEQGMLDDPVTHKSAVDVNEQAPGGAAGGPRR